MLFLLQEANPAAAAAATTNTIISTTTTTTTTITKTTTTTTTTTGSDRRTGVREYIYIKNTTVAVLHSSAASTTAICWII